MNCCFPEFYAGVLVDPPPHLFVTILEPQNFCYDLLDMNDLLPAGNTQPIHLKEPTEPLSDEDKLIVIRASYTTGRPMSAALDLGYSPLAFELTLEQDSNFRAQVNAVKKLTVERLEKAADQRAIEGWDEPQFWKGEECGVIRKFSDTLLIERMRAEDKQKYGKQVNVDAKVAVGVLAVPISAPNAQAWAAAFSTPVASPVASAAGETIDVTEDTPVEGPPES